MAEQYQFQNNNQNFGHQGNVPYQQNFNPAPIQQYVKPQQPLSNKSKWTRYFIVSTVASSIFSVLVVFATESILESFSTFFNEDSVIFPDNFFRNLLILVFGSIVTSILSLTAGILFIVWHYTANQNLLNFSTQKFPSIAVIFIWLVPSFLGRIPWLGILVMLVGFTLQYLLMSDLLKKSAETIRDASKDKLLLMLWIITWSLSSLIPAAAGLLFAPQTIEFNESLQNLDLENENINPFELFSFDFSGLILLTTIGAVFSVISIFPIIALIKNISRDQDSRIYSNPVQQGMY